MAFPLINDAQALVCSSPLISRQNKGIFLPVSLLPTLKGCMARVGNVYDPCITPLVAIFCSLEMEM